MSGAPEENPESDLKLAKRCIRGDADAHNALRTAYYNVVCRILMSRGASETESADLAGDLFRIASFAPKMERACWAVMEAGVLSKAGCSPWQAAEQLEAATDPLTGENPSSPHDPALVRLLRFSLRKGVYLHGVTQREIAELWGWHESKVSRTLSRALKTIGTVTMESVHIAEPELELNWNDFLELVAAAPDVFRREKMLQDDEVKSS